LSTIRDGYVAASCPEEQLLVGIWQELLGVERIGIHDNFFDLGGDSVLAVQIAARALGAGLSISPRHLVQSQTIAELAGAAVSSKSVLAEQESITGPVPLGPAHLWFLERNVPRPGRWSVPILVDLRPGVEFDLLDQALRALLTRHDGLRLSLHASSESWQGLNLTAEQMPRLGRVDLSRVPQTDLAAAIRRVVEDLCERLVPGSGDPLLALAWLDLGRGRGTRLALVLHHLLVDIGSQAILIQELHAIYEQFSRGPELTLPAKTTSFRAWSSLLRDPASRAAFERSSGYWLAAAHQHVPPLPSDQLDPPDAHSGELGARARVSRLLQADETASILAALRGARTQLEEAALTAIALAIRDWSGAPRLRVDLEGYGREVPLEGCDLARTVGWFTAIYPLVLDLTDC
jgi:hypothetical protein